jgi:hypothetical protein
MSTVVTPYMSTESRIASARTRIEDLGAPPIVLVLAAIVSVQIGAAFARTLFSEAGPVGVVMLRLVFGGAALGLLWRPRKPSSSAGAASGHCRVTHSFQRRRQSQYLDSLRRQVATSRTPRSRNRRAAISAAGCAPSRWSSSRARRRASSSSASASARAAS